MTPINIIIDNKSIIDDVVQCDINQTEGQYCNSLSLSLKSKSFWALCDPTTHFGTLRIKVIIGSTTYQFLAEERDTTPSRAGVAFTVWGRSKQALLSKPYSKTITDTESTNHPWQTGNTTASAIVAYVIANYCPYSVTVNWNVNDFIVYADSFGVSNQSPIDVISSLAQVTGAELNANTDGSLSVTAYSVTPGASIESYNDLDDIVQLGESIDYPSGFNAVTVYGYGASGGSTANANIVAEHIKTNPTTGNIHFTDGPKKRADGMGGSTNTMGGYTYQSVGQPNWSSNDPAIYPGREHRVRVYFYNPQGNIPFCYFLEGTCVFVELGTEQITEDVTLTFGKGNASMPNTSGETSVTGYETIPLATVSHTYTVNYRDYMIRPNNYSGTPYLRSKSSTRHSYDFKLLFYFKDKSAMTVYSFTVIPREEKDNDGDAGGKIIKLEVVPAPGETDATVVRGGDVYVRIYGQISGEGVQISTGYLFSKSGGDERFTETIVFTDGVGNTAYPQIDGKTKIIRKGHGAFHVGEETYTTNYLLKKFTFPAAPAPNMVIVWATPKDGVTPVSLSITASDAGSADVVLNVANWSSSAVIDGVDVEVDGAWVGQSNANGNVSVSGLAKGPHTVKLSKDGYLNSDLDDIENSSFTVE